MAFLWGLGGWAEGSSLHEQDWPHYLELVTPSFYVTNAALSDCTTVLGDGVLGLEPEIRACQASTLLPKLQPIYCCREALKDCVSMVS